MGAVSGRTRPPSINRQARQQQRTFFVVYAALILLTLFLVQVMRIYGAAFGAALLLLILVMVIAVIRPALGLGIAIVLTIVGDARAAPWWPAGKNLSSPESSLYLADGLTISPLELVVVAVIAVWLVSRQLERDASPLVYGPLWRPLLVFSIALAFGLAWGLGRGGDLRIAFFEVRPLVLIPLVYFAVTNLFTSLQHYRRLLWGVIIALAMESVHVLIRMSAIREQVGEEQSPVQHTAALHMNLVFLLFIASLWFGSTRPGKSLLLFLLSIPTFAVFLAAERRSAVVGLIIGGVFLAVILFGRNRKKFLRVIPVMALIGLAYVGAFWNAESSQVGFPAQAVRIIVQPAAATEKDAGSNLYREIENFDLTATIRSSPITGIGFGQPFLKPIPLPDISFFEFWEYIPHNSVLWMWTQVGVVGFIAFLYLFALGTAIGVRAARRQRDPDDASLVATMAAYVPMVLVVAFVDVTFDIQTTVLLAAALALVGSAERLAGLPSLDDPPPEITDSADPTAVEAGTTLPNTRKAPIRQPRSASVP